MQLSKMEIKKSEYEELVRDSEKLAIIESYVRQSNYDYLDKEIIKTIIGISTESEVE